MSIGVSEASLSDIAAVTNGDGFGGGNGAWWLIILVLLFGRGYGFGGNDGGSSVKDQYVLTSDFSQLSQQIGNGFAGVERRTDAITNGICDLGYTQQSLINGVNVNLMQGQFALSNEINGVSRAISDCCCKTQAGIADVNYNIANQTAALSREIDKGFCQTNYNMATQNSQTLQAIDRSTDRILERLTQDKLDALRDENSALRLAAANAASATAIINEIRPCPKPAYITCNPYANCGCNNGCGC